MKKVILVTFVTAVVLVNLAAWAVSHYSTVDIAIPFRIALIMGITFISAIFAGAAALVNAAEKEEPVTSRQSPSRTDQDS